MTDTNASSDRLKPYVIAAESQPQLVANLRALAGGESATSDPHAPERLVIVADGEEALRLLATRAADRLERRPDKPIHDVGGIYYYPEPLGLSGGIAWLFPGEGAQYLGMLQGLDSQWPEVESVLQQCDGFARQIGPPFQSLRYFIDGWLQDDRDRGEQLLRRLDNAMLSVLSAGWCLSEVAKMLGVPMQAAAGHSAGELAALMTAGSMELTTELPMFANVMNQMEVQSGGGDAELLAVAAAADKVQPVVFQALATAGMSDQAMVAMDNCPHQSIVVGRREATRRVREAIEKAGWIVEALSLQQPYHTPMFAPLMDPLRAAFDRVGFRSPDVPLYSCATGERFPDDSDQIRQLSLAHWHNPVRFQSLIQQMYADGVRLFLEVGPRGNISSFVADILRGQPHAAIPMDTPRLSTADQIVHAAAQLAAHHVPIQLEALDLQFRQAQGNSFVPPSPREAVAAAIAPGSDSVMSSHLETMQQLLAEQSDVMQQFLVAKNAGRTIGSRSGRRATAGNRSRRRLAAAAALPTDDILANESLWSGEEHAFEEAASGGGGGLPRPELPLLGEVSEFEPGMHLVMHRLLDPAIEHYATHHTVGGREVSAIRPEQCGLPVMPMTFTLEMMMEAALQLAPERVVCSISRVQLSRWLAFYERDPITIRIEATLMPADDDATTRVLVRVMDTGNREEPFGDKPKLAAVGTVTLAAAYPEAPLAQPLELTDAQQCETTLKTMYNNLFHGELFQGVRSLAKIGKQGIESTIEVLPRDELFRDDRPVEFLGDPVLLDVAMHPNAAWHLEQPDQTGRIMLPFEVKSVEFFGPRPAVGTRFECHGSLDEQSPRHFTHSVVSIDGEGRVWNRINGVRLWRFYLPFHEVNFHGPKNVYHLSEEFATQASAADDAIATARFAWLDDLSQPTLLRAAAEVLLSEQEYEDFIDAQIPHAEKVRWVFGRVVAKDAVRRLWHQQHGQRLYMSDIDTRHDGNGRPYALPRRAQHPSAGDVPAADAVMPNISVAHCNKLSYALASTARRVGVAVHPIAEVEEAHVAEALLPEEVSLLSACENRERCFAAILATKKAVAKATGLGLLGDWKNVRVIACDGEGQATAEIAGNLLAQLPAMAGHRWTAELSHDVDGKGDGKILAAVIDATV
ncbi:Phthiocerol synthesis polyketide synthase type I PpsE [Rosistilla ulvae]|uniref:Phthiocerol synthesis polyketide synthase type I PpsE n=1 Tax=Rosistilla ulvae TaxID=1930277 RepID=A0A517M2V8_9BACT|nr:polyketide synthase dehydratase domain-containing protein [Rosistilla ulvae]QDS89207.1 Phthiocerol synthesis polyketide synthase type I PpsE [Rosistilla ulvae]